MKQPYKISEEVFLLQHNKKVAVSILEVFSNGYDFAYLIEYILPAGSAFKGSLAMVEGKDLYVIHETL